MGLLIALIVLAAGVRIYFLVRPRNVSHPGRTAETRPPAIVLPKPETKSGGPSSEPPGTKGTVNPAPSFVPRVGETLEFAANVTKLNSTVANLKVIVDEHKNFLGKSVWHLQALAHTENPYRMVFELDDQFDSYSDAANLTSLQYELHLSERGQKVDTVERMLTSSREPTPPDVVGARVLPGTRDPIGFLMYLRGVDWSKTTEVRSPVFDGHKLYDVRAVLAARSQNVSVTAGKYVTTKIEIHVLDNGAEMKDAHFLLYLAENAERLPVLLEAVLPVATARVELTKVH